MCQECVAWLFDQPVKLPACLRTTSRRRDRERRGKAPHILDQCSRRKWVVSFTLRPLNPREESPRCLVDRRLGGITSGSEYGEEKNRCPWQDSNLGRPSLSESLHWVRYSSSWRMKQESMKSRSVCLRVKSVINLCFCNSLFYVLER
jgi:hypothetical protein